MGNPLKIGIVGLGAISGVYLETIARREDLKLVAVADLDLERASGIAAEFGAVAQTTPELLANEDVEVVLNLTTPGSHAQIALAAIAAGKSVYVEKPLAVTLDDGEAMVAAAASAGVRLGCAPDTVLGTGTQTANQAIADGLIGTPIAATAVMACPGHESWHPNPDFYYQPGGGPLLDMGPYYVTALVTLLGPVESVVGMASAARPTRTIGSGLRAGEVIPVAVDTHVTGVLRHQGGALSTLIMSFDVVGSTAVPIEVHGSEGSLQVPDPNAFAGDVLLRTRDVADWRVLPPSAGYVDSARGYGLVDMAAAGPSGDGAASGKLGLHVLEVMLGLLESARSGQTVEVANRP